MTIFKFIFTIFVSFENVLEYVSMTNFKDEIMIINKIVLSKYLCLLI